MLINCICSCSFVVSHVYHGWTAHAARFCVSVSVHRAAPTPLKSLMFSKGQVYLQGCAYFNFSSNFLVRHAKNTILSTAVAKGG